MSSPAAIAGIVVAVVIGTPLVVATLLISGYILYKYFLRHRSLLPHFSLPRKSQTRSRIKEEESTPHAKDTPERMDFDNEAFLNSMSSGKVDPDQQSQSLTQHTFLSSLSRDPHNPPHSPPHTERDVERRHSDQVTLNLSAINCQVVVI